MEERIFADILISRQGRQGKAGEGRGRQGKAGEGRGRQGKAGEGRGRQGKAGKAGEGTNEA